MFAGNNYPNSHHSQGGMKFATQNEVNVSDIEVNGKDEKLKIPTFENLTLQFKCKILT